MTPAEHALARARTYAWIGEVLLHGWTPRALGTARELPGWAPVVGADADVLAARHQGALGRGVSPHGSVFTSPDGLLGGAEGAWWADWSARTGWKGPVDHEPDHAGRIAAALGWLESARHDALRDGVSDAPIRVLEGEALARLGWVGWLAVAVRRQGVEELADLLDLLVELLQEHGAPSTVPGEPVDVLADPSAGLRDLAAHLLIPARCGLWLGPDDLRRLSARSGAPCGFGRRVQMAESLLFSAADHGALEPLADAFHDELGIWDGALGPDPRRDATRRALTTLASVRPSQ